jgi:hypothetical protein
MYLLVIHGVLLLVVTHLCTPAFPTPENVMILDEDHHIFKVKHTGVNQSMNQPVNLSIIYPFNQSVIQCVNMYVLVVIQMHNILELIKKEQNIYNIIFHELIRQASLHLFTFIHL